MWYRDQGVQQLHAGLVARDGKGVLFIGQSGSGKSTCTLACALDGFDYLGDDHNGLQMTRDGRCIGHSFYNAARIGPGHLKHFPELRPHEVPPHNQYDHKSLVFMTQVRPGQSPRRAKSSRWSCRGSCPAGPTRFRRASKVQTLIALAPSTLKMPMGAGLGGFMNLTEFIPKMPCFLLECGPDVRRNPQVRPPASGRRGLMNRPTISCVIPAYNAETYLDESIRSVLNQTVTPDEVLVVDDGSADRTWQIAESFGRPVRYVLQDGRGPFRRQELRRRRIAWASLSASLTPMTCGTRKAGAAARLLRGRPSAAHLPDPCRAEVGPVVARRATAFCEPSARPDRAWLCDDLHAGAARRLTAWAR